LTSAEPPSAISGAGPRLFDTLLKSEPPPDFIFLPHFKAVPNLDDASSQ
jgi:hypothetical protein